MYNTENCGSYLLEKSGNGELRLSCFAEDYALRANSINSEIGGLSEISFAENTFKKKDLNGYRLNQDHPQFNSHTLKLKYKPFKVNLLGPQFLSEKHEKEEPDEFAKCGLLFFKPWLKTPLSLKSHSTWTKSLKEWDFYSRQLTDK